MPKQEKELDPRISAMIQGAPKFAAFLVVSIGMTMPKDELDAVLEMVDPRSGIDFETVIAGRPLREWMGRNADEILSFAGNDADKRDEVIAALRDRGMSVQGDGSDDGEQAETEPTFGPDNLPLSQLAVMEDDEILALEGIGEATLGKIREAQEKAGLNTLSGGGGE